MRMRLLLIIMSLPFAWTNMMAATNFITREIRSEGESVRVEDRLRLIVGTWNTVPLLQDILKVKREKGDDAEILYAVRRLVQNEALEVVECKAELDEVFMSLHMVSNVKLNYERPVKLNCLPSYAGTRYFLPYSGRESEPLMLVFAGNGIRLLWLPEWDFPDDLTDAVKRHLDDEFYLHELFQFTNALHLRCVLKVGPTEHVLFEDFPWNPPQPAPDFEFLEMLQRDHKMSGGDWRRLFTNLKPGKGGYYLIDSTGLTNRGPFSPSTRLNRSLYRIPRSVDDGFTSRSEQALKPSPDPLTIHFDGSSDDWKKHQTAWSNGANGINSVRIEGVDIEQFFAVDECYYVADTNYLYLFLKFTPTIEARSRKLNPEGKLRSLGNVGFFYVDADGDRNTGARTGEVKPHLVGSDLLISVTAGTYATPSNSVSQVSYHLYGWNSGSQDFDVLLDRQSSVSHRPLINHGKDGVEMAIPLANLRVAEGHRLILTFESDILWQSHRVIPITLK